MFIFGSAAYGYSSNIFFDSTNQGDSSVTTEVGVELKRKAGILAVSSTAKLTYLRFKTFTDENALNPNFIVEFSKATGRTTGSLSVSAYRESRSDSAVNVRTNSWNAPVSLTLKYPINDKFSVSAATGFLSRNYTDNTALTDYTEFSEALDGYYRYTSKLDLVTGYRLRLSRTTTGEKTQDHWFNFGATGGLFAKINGTIRVGYQIRQVSPGERFGHLNALAALSWTVSRKFSLTNQISRDFNTIATGSSVDSTGVSLQATYLLNRKLDLESTLGYGRNAFLGVSQLNRRDKFWSWDFAAHFKLTANVQLAASYLYLKNDSTEAFANFERQGVSLEISARY